MSRISQRWDTASPRTRVFTVTMASVMIFGGFAGGLFYNQARIESANLGGLIGREASGSINSVQFFGDSLNYGLYASSPDSSFQRIVLARSDALASSATVVDGTEVGGTVDNVRSKSDLTRSTDLNIVELGTNDVGRTNLTDFANSYTELISSLQSASPGAGLICLGVWQTESRAVTYDDAIRRTCTQRDGRYIGLSDLFDSSGSRGPAGRQTFGGVSDDFHPNDVGHRAIANRIVAELGTL